MNFIVRQRAHEVFAGPRLLEAFTAAQRIAWATGRVAFLARVTDAGTVLMARIQPDGQMRRLQVRVPDAV